MEGCCEFFKLENSTKFAKFSRNFDEKRNFVIQKLQEDSN